MIVVVFFWLSYIHVRHTIEINQYYWHGDHHQVHAIRIKMEIEQKKLKSHFICVYAYNFFASNLPLPPLLARSCLNDKNIDLPSKTPKMCVCVCVCMGATIIIYHQKTFVFLIITIK